MTLQELFDSAANNPTPLLIYFVMLPVTAFIVGFMSEPKERYRSPWKYLYSSLIYGACIPGILSLVLIVYTSVFERGTSLLQVNALVYFMPIVVMGLTIFLVSNKVNLNRIPGFNRLSGLLMVLTAVFITILIIQKTRIWVIFHGSIMYLVGLFLILFLVFRWGLSKMTANTVPDRSSDREDIEIW